MGDFKAKLLGKLNLNTENQLHEWMQEYGFCHAKYGKIGICEEDFFYDYEGAYKRITQKTSAKNHNSILAKELFGIWFGWTRGIPKFLFMVWGKFWKTIGIILALAFWALIVGLVLHDVPYAVIIIVLLFFILLALYRLIEKKN